MSQTEKILRENFPLIDDEVQNYVLSVLKDHEEFVNGEDVYESIGEMLLSVTDGNKTEQQVRDVCFDLLYSVKG